MSFGLNNRYVHTVITTKVYAKTIQDITRKHVKSSNSTYDRVLFCNVKTVCSIDSRIMTKVVYII